MRSSTQRRLDFLRKELDRLDGTGQSTFAIQQEIARLQAQLGVARPAKAVFQQMRNTSTRAARRNVTRTVRLQDLPEDVQVLIADFVGDDLDPETVYSVFEIPTAAFPRITGDRLDPGRGVKHAGAMTDWKSLPPVLVHGDKWLDGRHRVYAARMQRRPAVEAIDLEEHGQRLVHGMESSVLGKLTAFAIAEAILGEGVDDDDVDFRDDSDLDVDDLMDAYVKSDHYVLDQFPGVAAGLLERGFKLHRVSHGPNWESFVFERDFGGALRLAARVYLYLDSRDVNVDIYVGSQVYDEGGVRAWNDRDLYTILASVGYARVLSYVDEMTAVVAKYHEEPEEALRGEQISSFGLEMNDIDWG